MMAAERSQVRFGLTAIPYEIHRTLRRGTVSIAIAPAAGVLVTAPAATSIDRLDQVVHRKARWIVEHLNRQPREIVQRRGFESGETFLYLGRPYRLRVQAASDAQVALIAGRLLVRVPTSDTALVTRALTGWYRKRASARLPERVAIWAKRLRGAEPVVLIRDQRRRWASCDPKGNLRINWRIVQAPMRLVDYVVAHELVHLQRRHHTPACWATLGKVMPDYEARREALRAVGPRLEW